MSENNINLKISNEPESIEQILAAAATAAAAPAKIFSEIDWTTDHEGILVDWADKAMCYRWLHIKSNGRYSRLNAWFTIPVIIMSTLTGTANFAQDKIPSAYASYASMGIGAINIFSGILTTIQQFLKIGELNEAHRASGIAWGKFYRNVKVELAKSPIERTPVLQLLKASKEEFDRLMETSPSISDNIVNQFSNTFSGGKIQFNKNGIAKPLSRKQTIFAELNKPEICDTIESAAMGVYKAKSTEVSVSQDNILIYNAVKKSIDLKKKQQIEQFIEKFEKDKKRSPTQEEIITNLDSIISSDSIQTMMQLYNSDEIV